MPATIGNGNEQLEESEDSLEQKAVLGYGQDGEERWDEV
jgi:hypothetical protein